MPRFERYAIYYTPPPGPLASFGAAWLGWDIASGAPVAHPDVARLPAPVSDLSEAPRRYGLHATLMPPFRLAEHCTEADLYAAFQRICTTTAPVPIGLLELAQLGRFLALVPRHQDPDLTHLAAQIVRHFDPFRAPLGDADMQRRDTPNLTAKQRENLHRWGYPHVMDQFRFHITLTGKHPKAQTRATYAALHPVLAPWLNQPFSADALSLVGQDALGRFHTITRSPLVGQNRPLL
ncbi:DUF1045 domain-containing protein [Rhodobacteraceae bacterium KMM 6894]|nr:DUF1045 domain-containing protein [Rhodobacteraceae bacterium KMM 6894]